MESSLNTLYLLAEVLVAFVASAAIVASLRVSFGEALRISRNFWFSFLLLVA